LEVPRAYVFERCCISKKGGGVKVYKYHRDAKNVEHIGEGHDFVAACGLKASVASRPPRRLKAPTSLEASPAPRLRLTLPKESKRTTLPCWNAI